MSEQRARPTMGPNKSRVDYIEELFMHLGLTFQRHIFAPSAELEQLLELYIDARDDALRWHKAYMDLSEIQIGSKIRGRKCLRCGAGAEWLA